MCILHTFKTVNMYHLHNLKAYMYYILQLCRDTVFLLVTDEDTALAPANLQPTVTNTETSGLHSTVLYVLYCTVQYVHLTFAPTTVLYRLYMWALFITFHFFMLSLYNFFRGTSINSKSEYCLKGPSHQIMSALEVMYIIN
jgi:hypothetical protein